ncbi:MAG: acetamidase/formamidase family protein [Candidatus Bathyarchaeota archaeon]|nr:acetamidase/formamidase family protein [Candidatus Bathyarchaeota archaeon]
MKTLKKVSRSKVVYTFSPRHNPAERVKAGEEILLELEDAFGGQVKDEKTAIENLDWTKVNGVTGPVFIEDAEPGDTLAVQIVDVKLANRGVIAVIPKQGVLKDRPFKAKVKVVPISGGYVHFGKAKVKVNPMIGTIGVAPENGEHPTGTLGRHGGNMDVKEITRGATLYLPVFAKGALFAAGDLHAVQADGEACVSAVEVSGEVTLTFNILKGKNVSWPILETKDCYAVLTCGDSLDEACSWAVEEVVKALMQEHKWSFEEAYMFTSLVVDLKINQVVDPKKGVRAVIPKKYVSIESFCHAGFRH